MCDWMVSSVGDQCADRKEGCLHIRLPALLCDSVSVLVLLFSFSLHSSPWRSLPQGPSIPLFIYFPQFIFFWRFPWTVIGPVQIEQLTMTLFPKADWLNVTEKTRKINSCAKRHKSIYYFLDGLLLTILQKVTLLCKEIAPVQTPHLAC